jgi:membrane fusion protein (multidrug efflux system)
MKTNSVLKLKHVAWASASVLVVAPSFSATHSGAKPAPQTPPPPAVNVAQLTGYLLRQIFREGSYLTKGQLLFEIDPRPFQAELVKAKGQLAQAETQLVQEEARLATAEANALKRQLDVQAAKAAIGVYKALGGGWK